TSSWGRDLTRYRGGQRATVFRKREGVPVPGRQRLVPFAPRRYSQHPITTNPCSPEPPQMPSVVNAFSIDVEDYFQVAALAPAVPRESWPTREYRVERNTEVILNLLAERGIRGTFFILGWCAERSPQLIRRIAAAGHEIACHGFSHRLIYEQTPEEFREEA